MCVPVLKCRQLQGAKPPDPPTGGTAPGPPLGVPPRDPRYRLVLPRSPYCVLSPPYYYFLPPPLEVTLFQLICRRVLMSHSKALLVAPSAESDYNERFTLHLFVKPVSCTTTVMLTFILVCRGVHSINTMEQMHHGKSAGNVFAET